VTEGSKKERVPRPSRRSYQTGNKKKKKQKVPRNRKLPSQGRPDKKLEKKKRPCDGGLRRTNVAVHGKLHRKTTSGVGKVKDLANSTSVRRVY